MQSFIYLDKILIPFLQLYLFSLPIFIYSSYPFSTHFSSKTLEIPENVNHRTLFTPCSCRILVQTRIEIFKGFRVDKKKGSSNLNTLRIRNALF